MIRRLISLLPAYLPIEKKVALAPTGRLLFGMVSIAIASAFIQIEISPVALPKHIDRIFQVNKWLEKPGGERLSSNKTAGLLAPSLANQLPEIERIARFMTWPEEVAVRNLEKSTATKGWSFADPAFLEIFEVQLVKGDLANALNKPGQVILTESIARQLFGTTDIVGKTLMGIGGKTYQVSGVARNAEKHAKVQFSALASWSSTERNSGIHDFRFMNNWVGQTAETYVLLRRADEARAAENHLQEVLRTAAPGQAGEYAFFLHPMLPSAPKTGAIGATADGKFSGTFWGSGSLFLL